MKKTHRKLALNRESIRTLGQNGLQNIRGGVVTVGEDTHWCTFTCTTDVCGATQVC